MFGVYLTAALLDIAQFKHEDHTANFYGPYKINFFVNFSKMPLFENICFC